MFAVYTTQEPELEAARRFNEYLSTTGSKSVLLLFSGGSAFKLLPHIDTTLLSERITISVLDERYTFEDEVSNFTQLTRTPFFERARKQHVELIDPRPTEGESLADTARRFDVALKHWHITHHDGIALVTMGVGPDGHTAGILPHEENPETFRELFGDTHKCVRGYHVDKRKNPHQDRMTTTVSYLTHRVHHAVVYAAGDNKRQALEAVLAEEGELAATPARILKSMRDVALFTDQRVVDEN